MTISLEEFKTRDIKVCYYCQSKFDYGEKHTCEKQAEIGFWL